MNIPLRQAGVEDTDIKSIAFLHCKTFSSIDDVAMTQSVVDFCSINEIIPKKKKFSECDVAELFSQSTDMKSTDFDIAFQ